jgi:hypothetical protein
MLANELASAGASPDHLIAWPTASLRSRRLGPVERFFLALINQGRRTRLSPHASPPSLGRTLPESRLRRLSFGILFKMPITTTKLSTNENEPTMAEATASP